MFAIPYCLSDKSRSSMPRGLPKKCVSVKLTLILAIFQCICDGFGKI
jgi:hypothetical protein